MPAWLLVLAVGAAGPAYTADELVVLNGIGGFGDVGRIVPDHEHVSPNSDLGFSLRVEWQDRPGGPPFWSIRTPFPPGIDPTPFDRLAFDLYVVETAPETNLGVLLLEADDDRWVCHAGPLSELEPGRWHHFEVARADMKPWLIGNGQAEWPKLDGLALEPSQGRATFCVDGVRLLGPNGARLEVFNVDDDGLWADPSWHEPLQAVPEPGVVYLPAVAKDNLGDTPERLGALLGRIGTTGFGPALVQRLAPQGVPVVYYSGYGQGYTKYLTRRGAWDRNLRGEGPGLTPFFVKPFNHYHTMACAHPGVTEAGRHRIDRLIQSGIGIWMAVDYVFPWADGPFGYSDAMLDAYRHDLAGDDEGLMVNDGGVATAWHFADYFAAYHGFTLAPADAGLTQWDDFAPPATDDHTRAKWETFELLRSYEWLKLADRSGRYLQERGGHGLWVVPNPEDTWGSSDYVMLIRSAGVVNLFPEWFGNAGPLCEATYASGGYLREAADRAGSRLSVLFETGAGGHAQPYWDWQVAYTTAYLLTAATHADDFDNDFLNTAPYEVASDPAKGDQEFNRFRDTVAKALGFQQARAERPQRPTAEILCLADRPPAKARGSLLFGLGTPGRAHSPAPGLSRAHLAFDLRDSLELQPRVLDPYAVLVYSPQAPRVGDLELLRDWVTAGEGRVLVTHSYVPTRSAKEFWGPEPGAALGGVTDPFGLGPIALTDRAEVTITGAAPGWEAVAANGSTLELPSPLTRADHGEALLSTDAGPLVSRLAVGGGEVIYLHYTPGDTPQLQRLDAAVLAKIAAGCGIRPLVTADLDTPVQLYDVPGGHVVAAWDAPTLEAWKFVYEPGIEPLHWAAPGVARDVRLPAEGDANWLVYDFWSDDLAELRAHDGTVPLRLVDKLCGLWYAGPASEQLRDTIAKARATRGRMRQLQFDGP